MKRVLKYIIDEEYGGKTVKDFLIRRCRMSGTLIKGLKSTEDGIMVNGERKFVTHTINRGDELVISIYEDKSENILPIRMDFTNVYEDEDIIIVEKPPNMPTHPSQGNFSNTLANALMYYWNERGEQHTFRAVNRLDKDTSGLMCVAKNSYAHAVLCDEIKNKVLKRRYRAIVCGDVREDGTVDAPIARSGESVIKRCVSADGQNAVTHYKVKERLGKYTVLELELETGRTHQIRVHMSHIGHPLLGDWLYGEENHDLFDRQALHSCYIELIHPISGKKITFNSKMPQDMLNFVKKLRKVY